MKIKTTLFFFYLMRLLWILFIFPTQFNETMSFHLVLQFIFAVWLLWQLISETTSFLHSCGTTSFQFGREPRNKPPWLAWPFHFRFHPNYPNPLNPISMLFLESQSITSFHHRQATIPDHLATPKFSQTTQKILTGLVLKSQCRKLPRSAAVTK